ncbi:MAG: outer membrane lipoprotein-sorting protein [Treponema sp.]|nr:MAG: outer membrane lipoprotein-sorting protein [Treponema sp.]
MKKKISFSLILIVAFFNVLSAWSEQLSGEQIMKRVENRPVAKTSRQTTTMKLINSKGHERVRSVIGYSKDFGDIKKTVMVFQKPSDVKGTGYLSYSYDDVDKNEDTWLYLPALGKSRRISGSSKNNSFMGTDFTYDDMGDRKVEEGNHVFVREETVSGNKCWVVETTPKNPKDMYSKIISWVRQDVLIPVKVEFYDRHNKLLKTLVASEIEKTDNIWVAKKLEMHNVQDNHRTVLLLDNIELNIDVKDTYFTVASLERGNIR